MIKIPCVDGPAKGEVFNDFDEATKRFQVAIPPKVDLDTWRTPDSAPAYPWGDTALYHVHRYDFFGHRIRIASVQLDPMLISRDDLYSVLASDKAKGAVVSS